MRYLQQEFVRPAVGKAEFMCVSSLSAADVQEPFSWRATCIASITGPPPSPASASAYYIVSDWLFGYLVLIRTSHINPKAKGLRDSTN